MMYNFDQIMDRHNTDCVKYDLRSEIFGNSNIIPMWVADMDFATPPFIIEAIKHRMEHIVLGYSLRSKNYNQAVISWMKNRHQWAIDSDWITFSPGVVPGLAVALLAFTQPGDKILIQPPVYTPFHTIVKNNQRELVYNKLLIENNSLTIDFQDFTEKIKQGVKVFIISSPHNPGGNVWKKHELEKMVQICYDHRVLIFSDEIHSDIVFRPACHIPLASVSPLAMKNTLTFMAPSKTFNMAGLSSSVVIIPDKELRAKYNFMLNTLHLNMGNIAGNVALEAAYTQGSEWLDQLLEYLHRNIDHTIRFFEKNIPSACPFVPEGTYLIWIDFRKTGLSPQELNRLMIEKAGVGLSDGTQFGPGGEGFMRMNVACPKNLLDKALYQIKSAMTS